MTLLTKKNISNVKYSEIKYNFVRINDKRYIILTDFYHQIVHIEKHL